MNHNSNENICRICLNVQDTLFSLYRKRHGTSPYEKLISRTKLNIQLNDSGPPSICSQCLIDLDTTVSFLDKCERSNQILSSKFLLGLEEECSNFKPDCAEVVLPAKPSLHEIPGPEVDEEQLIKEVKESDELRVDERCPECGSKRRCKHWAPPTVHCCEYCQKTFNKKFNYQIHIKRHLGEQEWTCSVCGAQQATRWRAERHCRPRARRACPVRGCGKSFTTGTNLHTHIRRHSGEKPFECSECGKAFISKNILNNHMRIHTGVKPYMCQICGKQFATNKLAAHVASHGAGGAGGAAGGRHACGRAGCARVFRSARAAREHARAHLAGRPHACALCDTAYKYKQSLNYHVRNAHGAGACSPPRGESVGQAPAADGRPVSPNNGLLGIVNSL